MTIIRANRVPSFLPSMAALHFNNPGAPPLPIKTPVGTFPGNIFSGGLCTGMTFTNLDFFTASPRILMVPNTAQPGPPLLSYVEQRWIDGHTPADWVNFMYYSWAPTHNTGLGSVLGWLIGQTQGTSWSVVNNELPKVMQDVDSGTPSPLTLVTNNVLDAHSILIWGYSLDDSGNVVLLAYDPNEPDNDAAQITFNISNPDQTIAFDWGTVQTSANGNPDWRAFFRATYVTNDILGAATFAAAGDPVANLGQLQPLAPAWNAWQSLGLPPTDLSLESPYSSGYTIGSMQLDPLGTAPATGPAACSWAPGRLDVFIQDDQMGIDHLTLAPPTATPFGVPLPTFSWEGLNQFLLSYPAAASWGQGRLDVFGVLGDLDFSMAHIAFDQGAWEPNWESLGLPAGNWTGIPIVLDGSVGSAEALGSLRGSPFLSRPAACSWGADHLDLVAFAGRRNSGDRGQITDTDANIYHAVYDSGRWTPWLLINRDFGLLEGSAPSICTWAQGRLDLFVITNLRSLVHRSYTTDATGTGSWSTTWDDLGSPPSVGLGTEWPPSPAACSWGENRLDVFAVGGDGQLWHIWFDGVWHPWEDLGGMIQSDPSCGCWSADRIDVFASASDFAVWHLAFQG